MRFFTGIIAGALVSVIYLTGSPIRILDKFSNWQEPATAAVHDSTSSTSKLIAPVQSRLVAETTGDTPPVDMPPSTGVNDAEVTAPPVFRDPSPVPAAMPVSAAPAFQLAWMPFRSEASATGFAEKLSKELDRHFAIVKVSPGQYEVGFLYQSGEERRAVLDAIQSLTGYRVPSP